MTSAPLASGGRGRPPAAPDDAERRGWRDRLAALRYVLPLLTLVWQTHRGYTVGVAVLRIARAFVPVAALWVGKLITDAVVAAREPGAAPGLDHLWRLVALEIAIVVLGEVLARGSVLVESLLGDLFANRISVRMMDHAATLDLAQFEDPEFYDRMERARRGTVSRIGLFIQLLGMAQDALTLASLGAALVVYNPLLLLLLAGAVLPSFLGETHFAGLSYSLLYRWTPQRRQLDYLRFVGASDRAAKEVQLFGLAPWLTERYRVLSERFYEENKRLSLRRGAVSASLSLVGTAGYYAAYVLILLRAVAGTISLGTLVFLAASFSRSRDLIQRLLLTASEVMEQSLYVRDLFAFFETRPTIASRPGAIPVPQPIRQGFVFEDVGFRYPGGERWAVRHLNLTLRAGERVALVGENGAGKTTITKLLARLYEPTEGRILLDGVDLRDHDLASLRSAIGVIFQDFVRYDMRFDENIGVGRIEHVRDALDAVRPDVTISDAAASPAHPGRNGRPARRGAPPNSVSPPGAPVAGTDSTPAVPASRDPGPTPAAIVTAAEQSLAASLLPRLPGHYQQMLGRRFDDGVDLSGGEWQKVALARAYLRDSQLLILDEPTAALDARAEYDVFVRFSELVRGRMAVLISHRFSTVRMADRIIVLDEGRVAEEGTHEALVARGGPYAELFALQAEGYR